MLNYNSTIVCIKWFIYKLNIPYDFLISSKSHETIFSYIVTSIAYRTKLNIEMTIFKLSENPKKFMGKKV